MKRYTQFEPVVIDDFEVSRWRHPEHRHNHYELIYIKQGRGLHYINDIAVPYESGDVFLLGPEEAHYFNVQQRTRFLYLKFTDRYLHQREHHLYSDVRHLEYLIKSRETHVSVFRFAEEERRVVDALFEVVLSLKKEILHNEQLIWMQVVALSVILQRNMPEFRTGPDRSRDMQAMFCYIHKHIYEPQQLKAEVMGTHFNLSPDYLGPYFKRHTGISLRDYIGDYRSRLIRQRLESGRFGLKQIAADFGLTDESHVSKVLKRADDQRAS